MSSARELDAFLGRPLICHLATSGPTVRPLWFLWEDGYFWLLSGAWSTVPAHIEAAPDVAMAFDTCDLLTGETVQVRAKGHAELVAFDIERGARLLGRYLGSDEGMWDPRFRRYLRDEPSVVWVRVRPERIDLIDLSYEPSTPRGSARGPAQGDEAGTGRQDCDDR